MYAKSTPEALKLKAELERRGIIVHEEKWDGYKHIDLAIPRAKLNVEVDGRQHYEDPFQIIRDLERNRHSTVKGYDTVHIPNVFVHSESDLSRVADALADVSRHRAFKLGYRFHYHSYSR